jgi:hypothetical protein
MLTNKKQKPRAFIRTVYRCSVWMGRIPTAPLNSSSTPTYRWRLLLPALLAGSIIGAVPPAASANIPDFMGDRDTGWLPDRPTGDDFLPPPSGPGPVMSTKGRPYVPNGTGQQPSYRIADLTNPILMPWVIERMKTANERVLAGRVPYIAREHCWPAGVPGFTVFTRVQPIHFIQTPTKVIVLNELNAEVRRIYLDVAHSPTLKPSWYGESIGHYEGDELVVDTIGANDKTYVDNYRTPHTEQIHVVERFKLTEDGRKLQALLTVTDPGAFNMPGPLCWRRLTERPMVENLCAENNVDFFGYDDYPISGGQAELLTETFGGGWKCGKFTLLFS